MAFDTIKNWRQHSPRVFCREKKTRLHLKNCRKLLVQTTLSFSTVRAFSRFLLTERLLFMRLAYHRKRTKRLLIVWVCGIIWFLEGWMLVAVSTLPKHNRLWTVAASVMISYYIGCAKVVLAIDALRRGHCKVIKNRKTHTPYCTSSAGSIINCSNNIDHVMAKKNPFRLRVICVSG